MTTFRDYLNNKLDDPEFKALFDAADPDFQITRAIAKARAESGMTQKELSEKTGITQAEISKMENGNGNPSIKTLKKLAAGMNMKLVISFEPIASETDDENNDLSQIVTVVDNPEYIFA